MDCVNEGFLIQFAFELATRDCIDKGYDADKLLENNESSAYHTHRHNHYIELFSLSRRVWQSILFTLFFFRLKYYSNLLMKLLKTLALRNYTRFQTCVRNLPAQKKLTIKMCQRFILLSIIFYLL